MKIRLRANKATADDNDITYNSANAIARAKVMESPGSILHEYYTYEQYIHRRGTFIGRLPGNAGKADLCWTVRKYEAPLVFKNEQQMLWVEEVREAELAHEIDPLLPLPTESNTQTIDNFKTCPPVDRDDATAEDTDEEPQDDLDVETPGADPAHSTSELLPKGSDHLPVQSVPPNAELDRIRMPPPPVPKTFIAAPGVSSYARLGISPPVKSPASKRSYTPEPESLPSMTPLSTEAPDSVAKPDSQLQTSADTPIHTRTDSVEPSETTQSAHKRRKTTHRTPQTATKPSSATNAITMNEEKTTIDHATAEKITAEKTTAERTTARKATAENAAADKTVAGKTATEKTTGKKNTAEKTTTENVPARASTRRLEGIMAGKILPRSKKEATEAAKELHTRLLDAHLSNSQQSGSKKRKSARIQNDDPDLMPHHFSKTNFTESEELGHVRCICGVLHDDKKPMFCCELCGAWQHFACVFPKMGIAKMTVEEFEAYAPTLEQRPYECSVCDPWGNREVLKKLRMEDGVGERFGKDPSD